MSVEKVESGIRDNHTRGAVGEFLESKIRSGSELSVVSAYFTIYAHDALADSLERIEHLNFLFGEPSFINRLDPGKTSSKAFVLEKEGLALRNRLEQKHNFQRRAASTLLSGRGAIVPGATETPTSNGDDFDLVTWLVILEPTA